MVKGIFNRVKTAFNRGDIITQLIIINVTVFVVTKLCAVICLLFSVSGVDLLTPFALPASWAQVAAKPWTLLSYMFLHSNLMHILFNMLCLYWFGRLYLSVYNAKSLVWVFLLGGVFSGLFYLLCMNLFPYFGEVVHVSKLIGASGSIMAIMAATAVRIPDQPMHMLFIGVIRLKYLFIVLLIIDLLSMAGGNAGGHFAHIGGALFGVLYFMFLKRNIDIVSPFLKVVQSVSGGVRRKDKMKVKFHRPLSTETKSSSVRTSLQSDSKMVSILEKLKTSGYSALSQDEREYLFRAQNSSTPKS